MEGFEVAAAVAVGVADVWAWVEVQVSFTLLRRRRSEGLEVYLQGRIRWSGSLRLATSFCFVESLGGGVPQLLPFQCSERLVVVWQTAAFAHPGRLQVASAVQAMQLADASHARQGGERKRLTTNWTMTTGESRRAAKLTLNNGC